MRKLTYILILLNLSSSGFGQMKKNDLIGEWQSKNDDSLYYRNDTIRLFENVNHFYESNTCYIIRWIVSKRSFKINNVYTCTEPGSVSAYTAKENLRLTNTDFGQIITLERSGQQFDKFKIVNYQKKQIDKYPYDIKELKLMRFDDLTKCKLYKYVDSIIYKVLKYDSTLVDSTYQNILGLQSSADVKIRVRDGYKTNPEPMIVLNGHVVDEKKILKQFKLVETIEIKYLTNEQSALLYGLRALNGVIILTVSEKRFKEIWKNYGR